MKLKFIKADADRPHGLIYEVDKEGLTMQEFFTFERIERIQEDINGIIYNCGYNENATKIRVYVLPREYCY